MKKLLLVTFAISLVLVALAPPVKAPPPEAYYELAEKGYTINQDRSLSVGENYTIYNPSWSIREYIITRWIPTENTKDVNVWSDTGGLTSEVKRLAGKTEITIRFTLSGKSRLTYHVIYTADNMVRGAGPAYGDRFGGITLDPDDWPYQRYVVTVTGPAGSIPFLKDPYNAEVLDNNPPVVRYETSISAPGSFGGLVARFYTQPAFYKVTLNERFTNRGTTSTTDLNLDTILFNGEATWQFSALAWSNYSIQTMYVDAENNWHGVFDVGEIPPGTTKELQLGLIYEVNVYDPRISENDVGELSEASGLAAYLKPDDKWESDHLVGVATSVVGEETNACRVGQKIVKFVVNRLKYENQSLRQGALWAYQNSEGDCSEYTDLSIALARAAGLPARAMYGWGYFGDNRENVGHAWAEFYLPGKGWQPVEPTWPDTLEVDFRNYLFRLDPIHLTRNVRGLSSSESGLTISRRGAEPQFKEDVNLLVLTAASAAQEFISAAEYAIGLAEKLLADSPSEALGQSLQLAQQNLERARDVSDENQIISYAKSSIQHANVVIRALGKPPAEPSPWDIFIKIAWPWLAIICALIAAGGIIWKIRSR